MPDGEKLTLIMLTPAIVCSFIFARGGVFPVAMLQLENMVKEKTCFTKIPKLEDVPQKGKMKSALMVASPRRMAAGGGMVVRSTPYMFLLLV